METQWTYAKILRAYEAINPPKITVDEVEALAPEGKRW